MKETLPPTKKLCSCGADLSSQSVYHVRKHLAGLNHLKVQAASGLRAPTSTKTMPVVQRPCAELETEVFEYSLRGEITNQLKWLCVWQFGNCGPVPKNKKLGRLWNEVKVSI